MPNAQCPMPNAQCPMPNAPCPMPHAQCPMPHALFPIDDYYQPYAVVLLLFALDEKCFGKSPPAAS